MGVLLDAIERVLAEAQESLTFAEIGKRICELDSAETARTRFLPVHWLVLTELRRREQLGLATRFVLRPGTPPDHFATVAAELASGQE